MQWGTATDGRRVFFTESDADGVQYTLPNGQRIAYSSFGALDAATGRVLWQVPEPHGGRSISPVTYAGGVVYTGSMNNSMYALDASSGRTLWEYQGAGSSNAGPAIVGGRLYWGNGYSRGGTASTKFYSFALTAGPSSSSPPPAGACTATYRVISQWPGGFQGEVTVKAGPAPVNGWSVRWAFASGQTITQLWNGTPTTSGANVTVRNVTYNVTIPAGATTTFGFLAGWNGTNAVPSPVTCSSP
ncbi:cellulose binding domain-containing protein [Dactylosporangium sp. CA-233914]|uniref:cellulose binding domain-containing protein n=1 Tax=Dactylosporangium sp. CA-233914 TaxID=3239934 RepID=UPI003D93FD4F